ncbi:MAG: sugar transferase [Atopobiaceae bacterium]|nr:sugar transferase [Atopobiaceae bacterium]
MADAVASTSADIPVDEDAGRVYEVSPERKARRMLVDRTNMQAVYDAKPRAYKTLKRVADVVLSTGALVALSPVFAVTALAIVIEDGRPVIYAAPREGQNGKPFKMYKFRSMYRDAESKLKDLLKDNEQTGPAFKIKDDPRITRVGKFIRRASIDELPQLVNIIRGEMSIVGPRAIQRTQEYTPYEAQRLVAKPGLTCYWQVSGRANVDWEEWVELDLDYIQDMSVLTDIKLIAKTFGAVLEGEGGY